MDRIKLISRDTNSLWWFFLPITSIFYTCRCVIDTALNEQAEFAVAILIFLKCRRVFAILSVKAQINWNQVAAQ